MIITKGFVDSTIITRGFGFVLSILRKREYIKLKSIVMKIIKLRSEVCD